MSYEVSFDPDPTGESGLTGPIDTPEAAAVPVTDTPVSVVPNIGGGGAVTIQNLGPDAVYIGNENVTSATGLRLLDGEGVTIQSGNAAYAVCATGQSADVRRLVDG